MYGSTEEIIKPMYANLEDLKEGFRELSGSELEKAEKLLNDASIIVDAYAKNASIEHKSVVVCNMVRRALGSGNDGGVFNGIPIGATQGSASALGYTQSWTVGSGGSVGELYLTKVDKKLLGVGNAIGCSNPFEAL